MNTLQLMQLHGNVLFVHTSAGDLLRVNDWLEREAARLWIGFTGEGLVWRFRHDVPAALRSQATALIDAESTTNQGPLPDNHEAYLDLFNAQTHSAGPAYWLTQTPERSETASIQVTSEQEAVLKESDLTDWLPDIPHQQPMMASLHDGVAAAVCASVRVHPQAHEAGVETSPAQRRQGHATNSVSEWARALMADDIIPMYSTSWDNTASQALAARLGFQRYGWEYSIA